LKTLQEIFGVFQGFTIKGENLINLALDEICFREELYNQAKIYKPNTILDPDAENYLLLFEIVIAN